MKYEPKKKYGLLLSALLFGCTSQSGITKNSPLFPLLQTKYHDNYGQEIRIFFDSQVTNKANASLVEGIPTIYLNPNWMAQLSPEEQAFVFFHEVAHFRLNHVYSINTAADYIQAQKDADCYSGRMLRDFLQFTPKQMEEVYDLVRSFNDDGSSRQRDLKNCLESRL